MSGPETAEPQSTVNNQVADAVAATLASAVAGDQTSDNFSLVAAQAAALAMLNAVTAQQNAQIALNAVVLAAANRIQRTNPPNV
jgi:hypothetical protein